MLDELATGEMALGRIFQSRAYKNAAELIILMNHFMRLHQIFNGKRVLVPRYMIN